MFVPKHNNQLLQTQLLKLRQQGDIQIYIHDFQAILNRIEDEMADGDQLFFFLNGRLTNDCRRYVELHHLSKLQDALDYCLNFEQVHTNSQGQIPMELNFFGRRQFRNRNAFRRPNFQPSGNSFRSNFNNNFRNGMNRFNSNSQRGFQPRWRSKGQSQWQPRRFHAGAGQSQQFGHAPAFTGNVNSPSTFPSNVGRGRGRGRGNNANRKNFSNNRRGRAQFHMMNSSDFPMDMPHENNTISGFEENPEELIGSQNQTPYEWNKNTNMPSNRRSENFPGLYGRVLDPP